MNEKLWNRFAISIWWIESQDICHSKALAVTRLNVQYKIYATLIEHQIFVAESCCIGNTPERRVGKIENRFDFADTKMTGLLILWMKGCHIWKIGSWCRCGENFRGTKNASPNGYTSNHLIKSPFSLRLRFCDLFKRCANIFSFFIGCIISCSFWNVSELCIYAFPIAVIWFIYQSFSN